MKNPWIVVIIVLVTLATPVVNACAQKSEKLAVGYGSISTNYLPLWTANHRAITIFSKNTIAS